MGRDDVRYLTYIRILQRELVPAMGCTEPIAIAYCAAVARSVLGALPDRVIVEASGNIIKNVKSVIVPNTDGHRGIEAAAAIGILAGDPGKKLEVLSQVKDEQKKALPAYLANTAFEVRPAENGLVLDLKVQVFSGASQAAVRIANAHTNIVSMEKDGQPVPLGQLAQGDAPREEADKPDYDLLSVEGIYSFAMGADIADVKDVLDRQIAFNTAISQEGLRGDYGANIGSVLLESYGDEVRNRAKARAAAGSDARMNGCELPVVINSGSGNQGITVSVPVIEYAKALAVPKDRLYRALALSNLIAIHEKTGIGRLSAYCGAVSAGCAAGCGIAYLQGADLKAISHTLVNSLAIVSGIICDGAKPSCAAKIASSVQAGIMGYHMYQNGQQFRGGDGIVTKGVENTIRNVSQLGREGMRETDKEIVKIMLQES